MPCYHPIKGYASKKLTVNGKRSFVTSGMKGLTDVPMEIPCGQCIGCRLKRSLDWAIRISNEASLYKENCFITLTIAPEYLPEDGSLSVAVHQKFMKDLKNHVRYHCGKAAAKKIRFFMCGEYGEEQGRPHYHYCLLNFDFADKYFHRRADRGELLYRSKTLEALWPFGHSEIGSVSFDSAAYVARYIVKKITGPKSELHYAGRLPEFTCMSRNPGIGAPWFERFSSDAYPRDRVVLRSGASVKPPRFYDKRYEILNPQHHVELRRIRMHTNRTIKKQNPLEFEYERLMIKETVHLATVTKTLKRKI